MATSTRTTFQQHTTARIEHPDRQSRTDIELYRHGSYRRILVDRVALDPYGGENMDGDWVYAESTNGGPFVVFHIPAGNLTTITTGIRV